MQDIGAIGQAMRAAGIAPPDPKQQQNRVRQAAIDAVRQHPRNYIAASGAFFDAARGDIDLLWAMMAPFRQQIAQYWLRRPEEKLGRQVHLGNHVNCAPRASAAAGMAASSAAAARSLLEIFLINGQPIGDVTPAEADKWAAARRRDARFVSLLTANLPAHEPIRKYRTAAEAETLYAQAGGEDAE